MLYLQVLYNYDWIYAKMSACPLQSLLADYEDAARHLTGPAAREARMVADSLRLGGSVLAR